MKAWIPAAALFGLSACLENPGVDWKLDHKHDLATADYDLDGSSVRIRLERKAGETRLYLENLNQTTLDSLEFAIQICQGDVMYGSDRPAELGPARPSYCVDPISETHGLATRLPGWSEADLGPLAGDFPEALDRVTIAFTSLRDPRSSPRFGTDRYGYYEGTWAENHYHDLPKSGSLRGFILRDGSYNFLFREGGNFYGSLGGTLAGDSLIDAYYLQSWEYHLAEALGDSNHSPTLLRPLPGSPDSLGFQGRFIYHFLPGRPDTLDLRISLARSPGLEWPKPTAGTDAATHSPN